MRRLRETLEEVLQETATQHAEQAQPAANSTIYIDTINVETMHILLPDKPPVEDEH